MNSSRVTLKDVANECGYTANTVSRAMRNDPHLPPATRQLIRETAAMLGRFPEALPESRKTASDVIDRSGAPLPDQSPELSWPWDAQSPSVITVFRECLGDALSARLMNPFAG